MTRSFGRTIAIAVVGIALLVSLLAANLVVGVNQTVLDDEFVVESLEEEDAYAAIAEEIRSAPEQESPDDPSAPSEPSPEELLSTVLTDEYVQQQVELNVERFYAYLHGDRDDLYLAVETEPLKDDIAAELARTFVEEAELSEIDPELAAMTESEEQFEATRAEFEEEQKERIQAETDEELSDEELDAAYDRNRDEIRAEAVSQLEAEVAAEGHPEPIEEAAIELGTVRIDGLLAEEMRYEEFTTAVEEAEANAVDAAEEAARTELDEELPDTIELTEDIDQQQLDELETVRDAVSLLSALGIALPLLSVLLALGAGWLTVTRSGGLLFVGVISTVAGVISVGTTTAIERAVLTEFESMAAQEELPPVLADTILGLLGQILSVFTTQSLLLVGLGVGLVGVGIGIRREAIPIEERPAADDDSEAADDPTTEESEPSDPVASAPTDAERSDIDEHDLDSDETDEPAEPDEPEKPEESEEPADDGTDPSEEAPPES